MVKWQIESSLDKDYIFARAEELGWLEEPPRVQVKKHLSMDSAFMQYWWVIEPYEEDCNCPSLVYPPTRNKAKV